MMHKKPSGKELKESFNIKDKIILTESQHRKILKETAKHDSLANKFSQELGSADLLRKLCMI